ncbi:DgyrCDS12918 [Dimorphilus gyrociliatus]|uniref:WD repeat-containing protein 89 n=1 Tax=Dimorphilus gyrociliatus TaxID=2664684 RepID=A0A7I8W970_9ANNE|nr:DgyrCDS12918 [Dimorphilus gyrociliatus]
MDTISKLKNLSLSSKVSVSLEVPDEDYVLHIDSQPVKEYGASAKVAASSSNKTVCVYRRNDLILQKSYGNFDKVIVDVKFIKNDWNLLYAASKDGRIRGFDLRCKEDAVVSFDSDEINQLITCFDIDCSGRLICAGTDKLNDPDEEDTVHLIFWDARKPQILGAYSDGHDDDITQVKFHPENKDILASGSTDGLVNIFNVSEASEDDALQMTLNTESSVAEIDWTGDKSDRLYCLTHTESLLVWESNEWDCIRKIQDIREETKKYSINYAITLVQVDGHQTLVAGTDRGNFHLFSLDDDKLDHLTGLELGHSDIVRCAKYDSEDQSLLTGGEDSLLCLWDHSVKSATETTRSKKLRKSTSVKTRPYSGRPSKR